MTDLHKCAECPRVIDLNTQTYSTRAVEPDVIYCSGVCASKAAERDQEVSA